MELPIFSVSVLANNPSPIQFGSSNCLNIDNYLVQNKEHTFLMRVRGDSMSQVSVFHDDLLVVDCSLKPRSKDLIVAVANREFILRRFIRKKNKSYLENGKTENPPIEYDSKQGINIWGVVTHVVHKSRTG
ncbi:MAG: S24 family peptidase [Spirochaetota bacterium]